MLKIGAKIDEVRIDGQLPRLSSDLQHFAGIGLQAVELPVHGLDAIKNGCLDQRRLREVLAILRDFDFTYSVHAPNPLNLMAPADLEKHLAVFTASLEFAAAVGAQALVYHSGRFIPEETFPVFRGEPTPPDRQQQLLTQEQELLRDLADQFPMVTICLENARPYLFHSPYCYAEQPAFLLAQVQAVARPNVKVTLDVGHLALAATHYQFPLLEAVSLLSPAVGHCHIHDNFGQPVYHYEKQQTHQLPFGRGDSHLPVGWGALPLKEMLARLLPAYQGLLIMELRSRTFAYTAESAENLRAILQSLAAAGRP